MGGGEDRSQRGGTQLLGAAGSCWELRPVTFTPAFIAQDEELGNPISVHPRMSSGCGRGS